MRVQSPAASNRKTFADIYQSAWVDPALTITVSDTQPAWTQSGSAGGTWQRADFTGQGTYFTVLGGAPFTANPNSTACGQMLVNGNGQPDAAEIEFLHPGQRICIHLVLFETDGGDFRIFVDDVPTTRKPFALPATANWYVDISNTSTYQTKKIRLSMGRCNFGFIYWDMPMAPRATTPHMKRKIGVLGDSYTGGNYVSNGTGNIFEGTWAHQIVQRGMERIPMGQGGTGYINNGSGNTTFTDNDYTNGGSTYSAFGATRRKNVIIDQYRNRRLRDLIIFGGGNDASAPVANVQAAASQLYADLAAACPDMNIYVVGPQAAPFNSTDINNAIKTAALAAPNVKAFIDQRNPLWIAGTGKIDSKKNDGNADYLIAPDGVHPTREGHEWLGVLVMDIIQQQALAVL